jgi:hypothetical protein
VFAGTRGFNGRVEGKHVGLLGDFLDDADLLSDTPHGMDGLGNGFSPFLGILGRLSGNGSRLFGVVCVLIDRTAHFLHGA